MNLDMWLTFVLAAEVLLIIPGPTMLQPFRGHCLDRHRRSHCRRAALAMLEPRVGPLEINLSLS